MRWRPPFARLIAASKGPPHPRDQEAAARAATRPHPAARLEIHKGARKS